MPRKSTNIICSIESNAGKIADFTLVEEKFTNDEQYGDSLYKITIYLNSKNKERIFRHDFATNVNDERSARKSLIYPTSEEEYQNIISNLKNIIKRQSKIISSNINSINKSSETINTVNKTISAKNVKIRQITLNGNKDNHNFRMGLSLSLKFEDKNIKTKYKCNWLIIDKDEDESFGYDHIFGGDNIEPDNLKECINLFKNNL